MLDLCVQLDIFFGLILYFSLKMFCLLSGDLTYIIIMDSVNENLHTQKS